MTEPFAKLRMALFCYGIVYFIALHCIVYFIVWNYVFYYVAAQDIHLQSTYSTMEPISKPSCHFSVMPDSNTTGNTGAPSIPSNAKPSLPACYFLMAVQN